MIQLHDHQKKSINEIVLKFRTVRKLLFQLSTGGGKTFIFSFLTKYWVDQTKKRVLILCHRTELIEQTQKSLSRIGVTCEVVNSRVKTLKHNCDVYIAMIETAHNRLNKNPCFFKNVDLVICDECHIQVYNKLFKWFALSKILGCTATPVVLKRVIFFKCKHCKTKYDELQQCCGDEVIEWSRPFTMSEVYEDIVVGAPINELIQLGFLVQDVTFVKHYTDDTKLKVDNKTGDYSDESMNEAYNEENALFNVVLNYEEICKGKKTMVFNSTSKSNLLVYQKFVEAGYNARMFDSVNKKESGNRRDLVEWFRDTSDAVLLNVGVFTTGFDVTDLEAIILNRPTNSLSLMMQMIGRGGRPTKKIYKDQFVVIDGGNNIERHNEWSDPTRDWKRIFFEGCSKDREKAKKEPLEDVQSCISCGYLMPKTMDICPECGVQLISITPVVKDKPDGKIITFPIRKIPLPNGEKIYIYTKSQGEDLAFARRILINQICDLFKYYRVDKETYLKTKLTGELNRKVYKMVSSCHATLFSKHDLSGARRTTKSLVDKTIEKLDTHYGEQTPHVVLREHVLES